MGFQIKSVFSVLFKTIADVLIFTTVLAVIIAILPNQLFTNLPISPTGYDSEHIPPSLDNWNNLLAQRSQYLLKDQIVGSESLTERGDFLYTGLADGRLVEINKETLKLRDITRFGTKTDCKDNEYWKLTECGRPLGLRFHKDDYLYVLDAFGGLYRVNVSSGDKTQIDFQNNEIRGLYNDLVFDPDLNIVYITVSSTKWHLDRVPYSVIDYEDTGYLFGFDLDSKKSVVLRSGFRFTNGIEISKDSRYLLVSETMTFTIHKISLQTIRNAFKQNKPIDDKDLEIFAKDLPGEPDNIRVDANGDVWFGAFLVRADGKTYRDYLSDWPLARKLIARVMYLSSLIIDFVNTKIASNHALELLAFDLYAGHIVYKFMPTNGAVVKLDGTTGRVKQILGSQQFNGVSEAMIDSEGDLYYGSFRNQFIGRIEKGDY